MGPTAVGKTELAVDLASRLPVDIISVDAAQVYRGMDIGTSKPDPAVLKKVPHRLLDICDPWERYSAGRFRTDAINEIGEILRNDRIPLLVGGTMFYFKSLAEGLSDLPSASKQIEDELDQTADEKGWSHLYEELLRIDPEAAQSISSNDVQRIQRLLLIYRLRGVRPSEIMRSNHPIPLPFDVIRIALINSDRRNLKLTIEDRFRKMVERGFLQEAEQLYRSPQFDRSLPAMRCVGYRQVWDYLDGQLKLNDLIAKAVVATAGLAKRQMTWIRNTADTYHVASDLVNSSDLIFQIIDKSQSNSMTH